MADEGERLSRLVRDVAYTAVGLGVLAFQQAQVRRRELERLARSAAATIAAVTERPSSP